MGKDQFLDVMGATMLQNYSDYRNRKREDKDWKAKADRKVEYETSLLERKLELENEYRQKRNKSTLAWKDEHNKDNPLDPMGIIFNEKGQAEVFSVREQEQEFQRQKLETERISAQTQKAKLDAELKEKQIRNYTKNPVKPLAPLKKIDVADNLIEKAVNGNWNAERYFDEIKSFYQAQVPIDTIEFVHERASKALQKKQPYEGQWSKFEKQNYQKPLFDQHGPTFSPETARKPLSPFNGGNVGGSVAPGGSIGGRPLAGDNDEQQLLDTYLSPDKIEKYRKYSPQQKAHILENLRKRAGHG